MTAHPPVRSRLPGTLVLMGTLLCALLAHPVPAASQIQVVPESAGMSSERLERITSTFQGYVDEGRIPGAVIQVMRGGSIVYREAFGYRDRESRDPQEVDDIFRIASQTKAIVSAAVLMLQERERS